MDEVSYNITQVELERPDNNFQVTHKTQRAVSVLADNETCSVRGNFGISGG